MLGRDRSIMQCYVFDIEHQQAAHRRIKRYVAVVEHCSQDLKHHVLLSIVEADKIQRICLHVSKYQEPLQDSPDTSVNASS